MELKNQVTNLELSKKLKELGVKQESVWSWVVGDSKAPYLDDTKTALITIEIDKEDNRIKPKLYSAFTVAELGEMLKGHELETIWEGKKWQAFQTCKSEMFIDKTEANARAKMLIYLLENKLIEGV